MSKVLTYEETKEKLPKCLLQELLQKHTYREIAKEYNVNERIVSKIAQKDYGIPKNYKLIGIKNNKDKVFEISKEEIEELYINQEMSARQIGNIFGVQHSTILQKLKDFNIEIRPFNYKAYYSNRKNNIPSKYIDSNGYCVLVINDNHIREHRYIMEQFLGRKLSEEEIVHHINFNKLDNDIYNLFLFENQRYHALYHNYIENNDYIEPKVYLDLYKDIIDKVCEYDFLYNLYVNQKMSANAIHKYILKNYSFDFQRITIIKLLKEYKIYGILSPTINQYNNRICANNI